MKDLIEEQNSFCQRFQSQIPMGAQASDAKGWWKGIQNNSGNYQDLTPLHQAARNGKLETVRSIAS
eukprot:scaffold40355_cov204-Skeletonema_marinoi.AAC.3